MHDGKSVGKSKTVWTNAGAVVLVWAAEQAGLSLPAEVAMSIMALVNVGLRLVTTEPIR